MPVSNFRDFGGYASKFGGHVVTERLYRSGVISGASDDARAQLLAHDFSLIVDLRYQGEQEHQPSGWPLSYEERLLSHGGSALSLPPHLAVLNSKATDPAIVETHFTEYYRQLPFDAQYRCLFAEVLRRLAKLEGKMLVHCTAGKDRTGTIVALIHHILGVNEADMMSDFLQSSRLPGLQDLVRSFVGPASVQFGYDVPFELLFSLMQVREVYLVQALAAIVARCGSIDAYLDGMGVDEKVRSAMRARLLAED